MKTYRKSHLPDQIIYNGDTYRYNGELSNSVENHRGITGVAEQAKNDGRKAILVLVQHPNLKHRENIHGKPYQPTKFIYTTSINKYDENGTLIHHTKNQ